MMSSLWNKDKHSNMHHRVPQLNSHITQGKIVASPKTKICSHSLQPKNGPIPALKVSSNRQNQ